MGNLRYTELGPDRLIDNFQNGRVFITKKLAVAKMNEALERAAKLVDAQGVSGARIRALKEKV